jgi:OmpA-OmpF porin, OOP family
MRKRITNTVALAALMAGGAGAAHATEGWYGRADVGLTLNGEAEVEGLVEPVTFESGLTQGLGLGYAFDGGFRLEGELSHRFNELKPEIGVLTNGDVHAWSAMANAFFDLQRGGAVEPYVGLGVGMARINANAAGLVNVNDVDTVPAYQGMVGLAIGVNDQLDLDVGYRYFVAPGGEFGSVEADYEHQAVTVGLRYQFEKPYVAPPPAPPPPPPLVVQPPVVQVCPTSEFVVYFEWDRSDLNQAAMQTIDAAVARARQCNVSGTVVVGHTDTSGSPTYNQGLSERRASVVRDALVARGMGVGAITAQARGESALARPTNDGVREPLNRRTAVTITFR